MARYYNIANEYGAKHGFHLAYFVKKDKGKEIYCLHDETLQGRKTGWPTFITVSEGGKVMPVNDLLKINQIIQYCKETWG